MAPMVPILTRTLAQQGLGFKSLTITSHDFLAHFSTLYIYNRMKHRGGCRTVVAYAFAPINRSIAGTPIALVLRDFKDKKD